MKMTILLGILLVVGGAAGFDKWTCTVPFGISHRNVDNHWVSAFDSGIRDALWIVGVSSPISFKVVTDGSKPWINFGVCRQGTTFTPGMQPGQNVICIDDAIVGNYGNVVSADYIRGATRTEAERALKYELTNRYTWGTEFYRLMSSMYRSCYGGADIWKYPTQSSWDMLQQEPPVFRLQSPNSLEGSMTSNVVMHLRWYITPPVSGYYTFDVLVNDEAVLKVEESGKLEDAHVISSFTAQKNYPRRSSSVYLTANRRVYVELRCYGRSPPNYYNIKWILPGLTTPQSIPAGSITPFS